MINIHKRIYLNLYWISARLVVLIILPFVLIGCQAVSPTRIPVTPIPTTIQHPTVTPAKPTVQVPTVIPTQQMVKLPSATPTVQLPSVTPTQQMVPPPSATPTLTAGISPVATQPTTQARIKTIFIIVMENHNWSDILNNPSAPYINQTLLPQASYAQQYLNLPGIHPSEPNYLWLEAGTSFGIDNDDTPKNNHQSTTDHLVTYLQNAGITWKAYQEDINGTVCPLKGTGLYAPKHNPVVYFDDVTDNNNPNSTYCIAHERLFSELQQDLNNNTVA